MHGNGPTIRARERGVRMNAQRLSLQRVADLFTLWRYPPFPFHCVNSFFVPLD